MNVPNQLRRFALTAAALAILAGTAVASAADGPTDFPNTFHTEEVATNGSTLHVRVGGSGPTVVLLHGYGETGDMWAALAASLVRNHTVIVPDLRGMGLSARAETGFEKVNEADDIVGVMDTLHAPRADIVAHDIGNMVAFALASRHAGRVTKLVLMDAPVPGVGPWEEILKNPLLWHFRFGGPDLDRLVKGRERIYLDRFWNEFSADPKAFSESSREHYARLYAQPGAMHAGHRQRGLHRQGQTDDAGSRGWRREVVWPDDGGRHARRRDRCAGTCHREFGTLAD